MLRIRLFLLTAIVAAVGIAPSTAAARTGALPDATYDAIVGAYQAIDAHALDDSATEIPKDYFGSLRAVCKKIPATDDLLASFRNTCAESFTLVEAMIKPCTTKRSCIRQLKKSAASADRMYKLSVTENRIVTRTVPAGACRKTLTSSKKDLKEIRDLSRTFTTLARALEANDERAYAKATKRMNAIVKSWDSSDDDIVTALSTHC